jgi:hypothetical protein
VSPIRTPTSTAVLAALALSALAACDQAQPRKPHRAPTPTTANVVLPVVAAGGPIRETPGPVIWDAAKGAFVFNGQPLRAEKLWTFDGTTEGFTMGNGEVAPADGAGLSVNELGPDSQTRTPRGLNVDGHTRSLVIVRATRVRPAAPFDGSVYYTTAAHGETAAFHARPVAGKDPAVGETTTLVFDMHRLSKGDLDWRNSIIDQVRIDLDDGSGGAFIVRQVAIALDPGGIPLAAAPHGLKAAAPTPAVPPTPVPKPALKPKS